MVQVALRRPHAVVESLLRDLAVGGRWRIRGVIVMRATCQRKRHKSQCQTKSFLHS